VTSNAPELSLAAELFLIAIDPATGRLVKRRRRRFRKALARSYGASWPGGATRARRAAIKELRAVGYIERSFVPAHYPVVSGSGAYRPLGRLRRCIIESGFQERQDLELFVLLAWTGVLARRLERSERSTARRRLKSLFTPVAAQHSALASIPPAAAALGAVAFREEMDQVGEMVNDLLSGDTITFDLSGGSLGGREGGAFGDAGGGDGGGGGGDGGGG
jgi:hypothetical protein